MKRAQLYLWSVLHSNQRLDDLALLDLAGDGARELSIADSRQRKIDLGAAVGVWAERNELADTASYIGKLRDDSRVLKQMPA